jgi:hypothetical protein
MQSAAKSLLRFAYSFMSFMLCQYYWHCVIFIPLTGEARREKNSKFLLLMWRMRPASPIGAANAPHLALKHRV